MIDSIIGNPLIAELAKELGVNDERVAKVLAEHVRSGDFILTRAEDVLVRARAGHQALGRLIEGQLAPGEAPQAVGQTLGGVCHRIGAREVPADLVPSRPREAGLPEAIDTLADAAEAEPRDLAVARVNPTHNRARAEKIRLFRATIGELLVSADLLLDNLAIEERQAADELQAQYKLVRPAAQASRRLGDMLGKVEDYLFGAQKQGAETRATGRLREQALTEKATRRARTTAETGARKEIADNLGAVLADFAERRTDDKPQGR